MSYEYVSDDEIAAQVLNCTGYKSIDCGYGYEIFLSKEGRKDVGIKASGKFKFDPCNNPSDAWPIILANNISITKCLHLDEWEVFGGGVLVDYEHCIISECGCFCSNKNPLRAAMIVFLMMQEGAQ